MTITLGSPACSHGLDQVGRGRNRRRRIERWNDVDGHEREVGEYLREAELEQWIANGPRERNATGANSLRKLTDDLTAGYEHGPDSQHLRLVGDDLGRRATVHRIRPRGRSTHALPGPNRREQTARRRDDAPRDSQSTGRGRR